MVATKTGNKGAKSRVSAAKPASTAPQSIGDALQQIDTTTSNAEALAGIVDVYERFLTQKDTHRIVSSLDELNEADFFESHVWRVRSAALDAPESSQKPWLLTVMLLLAHRLRRADSAEATTAAWSFVGEDLDAWRQLVATLTSETSSSASYTLRERATLVHFVISCFASLNVDAVAAEWVKLVSLAMWSTALSPSQRAIEFADHPKLQRHWKKFSLDDADINMETEATTPAKKKRKTEKTPSKKVSPTVVTHSEKAFMTGLLTDFIEVLTTTDVKQVSKTESDADDALRYIALMLTLLTDLLSALPTRRFLETVLRRQHVLAVLRQSPLVQWCSNSRAGVEVAALIKQMEQLEHAMQFPIDAHTGKSLTTVQDRKEAMTRKIQTLQLAAFHANYRNTAVETLAIVPVSAIRDRAQFKEQLETIVQADRRRLEGLGVTVGLFKDSAEASALSAATFVDCFIDEYSALSPSATAVNGRVALPTELDIWSESLVVENDEASPVYGTGPGVLFPVLSIPKLGMQYLNVTDFLERMTVLSQLEAAQAVRRDLEDAIRPLDAVRSLARNGETVFRGFAPSAVPLQTAFSVLKVDKPKIGDSYPAKVVGQFDIELDTRHDIAAFDRFQHREVVYLVTIRPTRDEASEAIGFANETSDFSGHFAEDYGVLYVRCAELTAIEDESGKQVKHTGEDGTSGGKGRKRTITVELEGAQYKKDLEGGQLGAYEYVNLLVRRDPRTNNFKAVLDTISFTLQSSTREQPGGAVPAWLYDLYLGYGDPSSASFEEVAKRSLQATVTIPLHHALGDAAHAIECCTLDSTHHVHLVDGDHDDKALAPKDASGPYTMVTDVASKTSVLRAHRKAVADASTVRATRVLTREQAQVVIRGTAKGLTLATGAPGTGKSEALAQLIQNLTQGSQTADEKILVIARSTTALDKLLDRVKDLPFIDEASIVRLGAQRTDSGADFGAQGRVDFLLQRRIDMLHEVDTMAKWMERVDATKYAGLSGSASYSCENALFFYRFYMKALLDEAKQATTVEEAILHQYFTERTGSVAKTPRELETFVARLEGIYGSLHRLQPFELLQLPAQRRDVYLMQHARVVAMTSRHAALHFQQLVNLKLQWTSVLIDEAAQLSQIDALIPLTLACRSNAVRKHELQRLVLVGDTTHHAPVEIASLQSYAQCHASLFGRFLRLGVPCIQLSPVPTKSQSQPPSIKTTTKTKTKPRPPPKNAQTKK